MTSHFLSGVGSSLGTATYHILKDTWQAGKAAEDNYQAARRDAHDAHLHVQNEFMARNETEPTLGGGRRKNTAGPRIVERLKGVARVASKRARRLNKGTGPAKGAAKGTRKTLLSKGTSRRRPAAPGTRY